MNIATFQDNLSFIKDIYSKEEWKDKICRDKIFEALEEANDKILKAFSKSIHNLYNHQPSTKAVEKVVTKFPSTLSSLNKDGRIPIQSALVQDDTAGLDFVVVLAKEGLKHNVRGEHARRNKHRFEYFTSLDPDALMSSKVENTPWIHDIVEINHLALAF